MEPAAHHLELPVERCLGRNPVLPKPGLVDAGRHVEHPPVWHALHDTAQAAQAGPLLGAVACRDPFKSEEYQRFSRGCPGYVGRPQKRFQYLVEIPLIVDLRKVEFAARHPAQLMPEILKRRAPAGVNDEKPLPRPQGGLNLQREFFVRHKKGS